MRKLIFQGNWLSWTDETGSKHGCAAKGLQWDLIRELFRGEPVHWLDGLLVFHTWQAEEQTTEYVSLFRSYISKAKTALKENLVPVSFTIDHPRAEPDYWVLSGKGGELPPSNIVDAIYLARESRREFCQGRPNAGWNAARRAYATYKDPKSICEVLICAGKMPAHGGKNDAFLESLKQLLEDRRSQLLKALMKVVSLASKNSQGVDADTVAGVLDSWIGQYFQVRQVLSLLQGHQVQKVVSCDSAINAFVDLLQKCRDSIGYLAGKDRDNEEGLRNLVVEESGTEIENLMHCEAVQTAAEHLIAYYEHQRHRRIKSNVVREYLQDALITFIEEDQNLSFAPDRIYALFT
jgi:hypothetical protein